MGNTARSTGNTDGSGIIGSVGVSACTISSKSLSNVCFCMNLSIAGDVSVVGDEFDAVFGSPSLC